MAKKYKLSLCAIMKDEGPYLVEWLEFHKLVGVERFYLYDNNSIDNTADILRFYSGNSSFGKDKSTVVSGEVISHYWPEHPGQMSAYSHCLKNYAKESEWIAFIDLDEFLFPTHKDDLRELLDEFKDYPAIGVNWLNFGTSGHETKPIGLQIENFTKRSLKNYGPNKHIKSIVRPERTIRPVNPHHFLYLNGFAVTEKKQLIKGAISDKYSVNKLRINHYSTRSKEESRRKMMRGRATKNKLRDWSYFESKDLIFNRVEDLTIQRFIPKLKKAIETVNLLLVQHELQGIEKNKSSLKDIRKLLKELGAKLCEKKVRLKDYQVKLDKFKRQLEKSFSEQN